jgi:long-chain acyl-CoA synthetase
VAGAGTSWAGPGADVEALLVRASPDEPADQVCGALMPYTSGTTGRPKGVHNGLFPLGGPWRKVERLLSYAGVALGVPADGTVLLTGPWHHSAQLFFSLLPLLRGARLVMTERFDATATLALIDRERVTETHLVPTQFVRLLRLPGAVRDAFSGASLRLVWHGAAPCPAGVKRRMIEWWGPRLTEYYAATEGGVVTQIDSEQWLRRPGSVGRAVPPNEVLVVDDAGRPVPPGVVGRVFVRRRADRDFRYHNAPAKTEAAHLEPGVFTYGERGHLDEHGYLYLAGRSDDMILSGGVNVYPAEVEEVLLSHPRVRDAAVLGLPDDEWGERVVAVVEMAPDAGDPTAELDRHCRRSLAGFKVPRSYRLVSEIPREPTGKLARSGLRSHFREERG